MTSDNAQAYIADLQGKIHAALGPLISGLSAGEPFALLDFPDIRNVGDSAIWLGEIAYFRRHLGRLPAYTSALNTLSPAKLEKHVPEGPILMHGGGNFGDIWPGCQRFRERVLQQWPDRLVIQLPQSIHFDSSANLAASAKIINAHKNFMLLVRDEPSLEIAKQHFNCQTILCPDMAFMIGPLDAPAPPEFDVLAMLRKDKEQAGAEAPAIPAGIPVEDWITEQPGPVRRARLQGALSKLGTLDPVAMRNASYNAVAEQRLGRGVRQLSRARAIATDRLHVHIISTLLGKPHAVLDNSYSKIARFRSAFPEPPGITHAARSLAEAIEWAKDQARSA